VRKVNVLITPLNALWGFHDVSAGSTHCIWEKRLLQGDQAAKYKIMKTQVILPAQPGA